MPDPAKTCVNCGGPMPKRAGKTHLCGRCRGALKHTPPGFQAEVRAMDRDFDKLLGELGVDTTNSEEDDDGDDA